MADGLRTLEQRASAYTNTPVERDAARRSLAAAGARTQASPEDLRIALEAAGLDR